MIALGLDDIDKAIMEMARLQQAAAIEESSVEGGFAGVMRVGPVHGSVDTCELPRGTLFDE